MGTALAWRARTGVPPHPAGSPRSRGGAGAAWRRREGEHSPSLLSPNSDRCGTRLPRYSLREPCMVCHIPVEMWRRGVTPTFPGVTSGYRAMPRCTPPRIRTGNLRHLKPTPLPVGPEGHVSCRRGYLRSASANLNRAVQGPREPSVDAGAGTSPHTSREGEKCWSGRRDSNPRPSRWQRDALPAALHPQTPTPFGQLQLTCSVRLYPPMTPAWAEECRV